VFSFSGVFARAPSDLDRLSFLLLFKVCCYLLVFLLPFSFFPLSRLGIFLAATVPSPKIP
jgi:hypothetical protein